MQIANPIYDVVFKYLLNDSKIAKLLLSSIIDEEILSLDFTPQESVADIEHRSLTVFRIDFSATIKTDYGQKKILIEIQKAKFAADIMRFRKYLGYHYQNKENYYEVRENGFSAHSDENQASAKKALPILSIYFLGYKLDHIRTPIIKVKRSYYDAITGDIIKEKEEFIESLTHDSFVIQIPYLKDSLQSDLEKLLTIFDQSHATKDNHILNINEQAYPEKYRPIIRRLQQAMAEPQVRKNMEAEDEILEELQNLERSIEKKDKTIQEKDKVIEYSKKIIEDNKKVIEDKDKVIEELRKQLNQDSQDK